MRTRVLPVCALVLMAGVIGAGTAYGASTRTEYIAQADPICKSGVEQEFVAFTQQQAAIQVAKKQARRLAKKHVKRRPGLQRKLRRRIERIQNAALAQFIATEKGVNTQLATLTPAPPDESLIQVWLRSRGELLDVYGQTLLDSPRTDEDDFEDFFKLLGLLWETNDLVRDFGFQHCAHPTSSIVIVGD
jgi:hypothetical protein